MNCSKKFLAATALAGAALLQGCATTGLPEYRSVDAGTRTQNTQTDPAGVRYHQTGEPVAVNYRACQALNTEIRAATSGNATNRAINQGTGAVGASINRGAKNIGDTIIGAIGGVVVGLAGDQATRAINTPRIRQLEADCNQENAYNAWQKTNQVNQRAYQQDLRQWQNNMTQCTRQEARNGEAPTVARRNCEAAFPPPR
jgi:hypothetical protein